MAEISHHNILSNSSLWSQAKSRDVSRFIYHNADYRVFIEEFPGYSKAMSASRAEAKSPTLEGTAARSPAPRLVAHEMLQPPNANLDDIIKDLASKMALEAPRLNVPNGDTWIFIDAPAQQPEQDNNAYELYVERSRAPKVMHSASLLALNSPFFEKAMGPTAQHRVLRRRGLVGKLPPQIKYVLDLTPPSEGDEAVYLLSELCCSEAVTKWTIAGKLWQLPKSLIGGPEEHSLKQRAANEATSRTIKADIQGSDVSPHEKEHQLLHLEESLSATLPYTALRHRSAIERVLLAIAGIDPELNSAPKLWTACAVAKYFEVRSPFEDYVIRWLRADPNHHFLEVLPEVSLKIADGLQCHNLCRDTFAILVGEEAVGSLYRSRPEVPRLEVSGPLYRSRPEMPRPEVLQGVVSLHGRRKEDLPEAYQTRIEYASKALVDRVANEFLKMVNLEWMDGIPEMQKATRNTLPNVGKCFASLKKLLKAYVKGAIYRALCINCFIPNVSRPDLDYTKTNGLFPMNNKLEIWNELLPRERVLTRSFWRNLSIQPLFVGPSNVDIAGTYFEDIVLDEVTTAELALRQDGAFEVVRYADIEAQAALYQRLCHPRNNIRTTLRQNAAESTLQSRGLPILSSTADNMPADGNLNSIDHVHREIFARATGLPLLSTTQQVGDHTTLGNTATQPNLVKGRPGPLTREEHKLVSAFMKSWVSGDKDRLDEALQYPYEWYESLEVSGVHTGIFDEEAFQLDHWDEWADCWRHAYDEGVGAFHRPHDRFHGAFSLHRFFEEATTYVRYVAKRVLTPTDDTIRMETHPLSLSDFLVSLEDTEFKYLPLWAGGCDDGSGGVYDDNVPIATEGFSYPGPNVHLGSGSSIASSEFDFIRGTNSHNTSTITQAFSQGTPSGFGSVRSFNENDGTVDGEERHTPSTSGDSEYDFGSTSSVGVGSTAERLARFGLDPGTPMSEKAKGKMAVRGNVEDAAAPQAALNERWWADEQDPAGLENKSMAVDDDDFASIFDNDEEDNDMDTIDDADDFDEGNDSDDTIGAAGDSDDDLVMV